MVLVWRKYRPPQLGHFVFHLLVEGKKRKSDLALSTAKQQTECAAIKRSPMLVSTMDPGKKRTHRDVSHGVCSEPTCSRAHFRSKKWVTCPACKKTFARLTRPACADNHALPFRHNTHFAHATCSRARMQTTPKRMPFGKICHSP